MSEPVNTPGERLTSDNLSTWGREQWLQEVQRLEAVKDTFERTYTDPEMLSVIPSYNVLVGKLALAREVLTDFSVQELRQEIEAAE